MRIDFFHVIKKSTKTSDFHVPPVHPLTGKQTGGVKNPILKDLYVMLFLVFL